MIIKEIEKTISEDESIELTEWKNRFTNNLTIYESLNNCSKSDERIKKLEQFDFEKDWAKIYFKISKTKVKKSNINLFFRIIAAVFIPIIIAIGFYYTSNTAIEEVDDLYLPGSSRAILVLDSGKTIELNDNDTLIKINTNSNIIIEANKISYKGDHKTQLAKIKYNTLVIPKGGEYQLNLPDGTKVWLNADTKLKYPVEFLASHREVVLEGEAYFEVKKDIKRPFIVNVNEKEIEVLGTKFNVRSYKEDGEFSATLNEGRVRVTVGRNAVLLMPNQQAYGKVGCKKLQILKVDASVYSAWKDMKFVFKDQTLEYIMNDVSRWYDVEIEFESEELKNKRFSAFVPRYSTLDKMLEVISATEKMKFEMTNGKVKILLSE